MERNDLIKVARSLYENPLTNDTLKKVLEETYPELKESEDERIKNEIIEFLRCSFYVQDSDLDYEKIGNWVSWLEKQKEQKSERINITQMVAKYRVTDEYVEGEYKGKPVNCMIRAYEQGIRDTLLKVNYSNLKEGACKTIV